MHFSARPAWSEPKCLDLRRADASLAAIIRTFGGKDDFGTSRRRGTAALACCCALTLGLGSCAVPTGRRRGSPAADAPVAADAPADSPAVEPADRDPGGRRLPKSEQPKAAVPAAPAAHESGTGMPPQPSAASAAPAPSAATTSAAAAAAASGQGTGGLYRGERPDHRPVRPRRTGGQGRSGRADRRHHGLGRGHGRLGRRPGRSTISTRASSIRKPSARTADRLRSRGLHRRHLEQPRMPQCRCRPAAIGLLSGTVTYTADGTDDDAGHAAGDASAAIPLRIGLSAQGSYRVEKVSARPAFTLYPACGDDHDPARLSAADASR